ncbi:MAG: Rrf2 family transcriptional regulator [Prolixibacteraceae bacterium]|jgi:Rrf2 family iron-sulfur cluster assembly transcriptional regulator|nr:Rrf2 family transcriptional regulator [Prolixibacteraceae bacterium]
MLSNTCKYAIRSLIYLANLSAGNKKIGIKKISEDLKIPSPFLGKILQRLAREKILSSTKGPHGGFTLGRKPEEISLFDIVIHVDGEAYFNNCIIRLEPCSCFEEEVTTCPVHKRFSKIRNDLISFYKDTSLADIVEDFEISGEIIQF